ncbi:MAG: threonine ammonia-lyase [Bacteroidales bacterium]|nr:threonine ammonia-lyase [Bacteroidales bacterium]
MLEISEIFNAAAVLKDVARKTAVIPAPALATDCDLYLKTENLQLTGSFKLRGAYYKISQLSDEEKARGVIACSAGNHAQGVALGATHNGIKALICLPAGAPISKVEATKGYGADVCLVPGVYDDAYAKAIELQHEHGYTFVHPFDDDKVIAGQGTIGLEILEQLPDVEAVVVPIGGGGLISGVAFAIKTLRPDVKVYGVQAAGAPSMEKSVNEGKICHLDNVATIADGIAVKQPGENTYEICRQYVDKIVTVNDDETAAAILALMERQKVVAEGAGAVSVAAVMFDKLPIKGKKVVCIVSGGNIDVNTLNRVITRGLSKSGRNYTFIIDLFDKPGQLSGVLNVIADQGGNVISVTHERINATTEINGCSIRLELETRDRDHIDQIREALTAAGFHVLN